MGVVVAIISLHTPELLDKPSTYNNKSCSSDIFWNHTNGRVLNTSFTSRANAPGYVMNTEYGGKKAPLEFDFKALDMAAIVRSWRKHSRDMRWRIVDILKMVNRCQQDIFSSFLAILFGVWSFCKGLLWIYIHMQSLHTQTSLKVEIWMIIKVVLYSSLALHILWYSWYTSICWLG